MTPGRSGRRPAVLVAVVGYGDRMERAGSLVIMRRRGQAEPAFAASIPAGDTGGIQTDHVESFRGWMAAGASPSNPELIPE